MLRSWEEGRVQFVGDVIRLLSSYGELGLSSG